MDGNIQKTFEKYKRFYIKEKTKTVAKTIWTVLISVVMMTVVCHSLDILYINAPMMEPRTVWEKAMPCVLLIIIFLYAVVIAMALRNMWDWCMETLPIKYFEEFLRNIENDAYIVDIKDSPQDFFVKKTAVPAAVDGSGEHGGDYELALMHKDEHRIMTSVYGDEGHFSTRKMKINGHFATGKCIGAVPDEIRLPYIYVMFLPERFSRRWSYLVPCGKDKNVVIGAIVDIYRKVTIDAACGAMDSAIRFRKVIRKEDFLNMKSFYPYFRKDSKNIGADIREDVRRFDEFMQPLIDRQNGKNEEYIMGYLT